METMKMIAGLDIGNGYVKGTVQAEGQDPLVVDFLSGVAFETNPSDIKTRGADIPTEIEDIFNHMEASFDSPAIMSHTVRLFGQRGIYSGKPVEEFDVAASVSKAAQDLSGILLLGSLAGAALQQYYKANQALPKDMLHVEVDALAMALPISEFKRARKAYADKFRNLSHMVSIHNFEVPVRVELKIHTVQVIAEGAAAQFAIVAHGEPLMNAMIEDLKSHGETLDGITAGDILAAENTIGIDIGEGTVNLPVFQEGRFNTDASMTLTQGYGTILERARERLMEMGQTYPSRKALADFLLAPVTPLRAGRYNTAQRIVTEEVEAFIDELGMMVTKMFRRVGAYTEVIYVYGGGATPLKDQLYPALIRLIKSVSGGVCTYPVLYLDAAYSRHLNREGLFIVAQQLAGKGA